MWVSQEAALRSTDDWKDTIMIPEALTCTAVLGLDVGKSTHWACLATRAGEVVLNRRVANSEDELDALFSQVGAEALVVVDQRRNIGALAISRAMAAGLAVAYLPGIAAHQASRLFAGDAKTDERDALVIAKTALGIPESLKPVAKPDGKLDAARMLASQRDYMVTSATRDKNRLRLDSEISRLLEGETSYKCLMTIPGIGARTASELVIGIDISDFPDHDHLASYCGIAPRNRRSGTSISSVSASRQGNKRLKNLLIFSCNSLVRSNNRFGDYYRSCRGRGMCHGEALKAVARKRLKVIYAIMRDKVPYTA